MTVIRGLATQHTWVSLRLANLVLALGYNFTCSLVCIRVIFCGPTRRSDFLGCHPNLQKNDPFG